MAEITIPPIAADTLSILEVLAGPLVVRRWLVEEGERVQAGQAVAELGLHGRPLAPSPLTQDSPFEHEHILPRIVSPEAGILVSRQIDQGDPVVAGREFGRLEVDLSQLPEESANPHLHPVYGYALSLEVARFERKKKRQQRAGRATKISSGIGLVTVLVSAAMGQLEVGLYLVFLVLVLWFLYGSILGMIAEVLIQDPIQKLALSKEGLSEVARQPETWSRTHGPVRIVLRFESEREREKLEKQRERLRHRE